MLRRTINNFSELQGAYDIVINCTGKLNLKVIFDFGFISLFLGLGSAQLCNDRMLVPIRGQVIKVAAPWIKMAYYADYDTYIVPGFTGVTLGGCRNFDSYDLLPNEYDFNSIKSRCEALLPSLKSAPVTEVKVGLRPHRSPVRVEYEFVDTNQGIVKVVHNYGHGGYGVTTAPGTAKHAARLVRDVWTGYSHL